jgi:hypothetical protein
MAYIKGPCIFYPNMFFLSITPHKLTVKIQTFFIHLKFVVSKIGI